MLLWQLFPGSCDEPEQDADGTLDLFGAFLTFGIIVHYCAAARRGGQVADTK